MRGALTLVVILAAAASAACSDLAPDMRKFGGRGQPAAGPGDGDALPAGRNPVAADLPSEEIGGGGANGPLSAPSVEAFTANVHPVVRARCSNCHEKAVAPFFSDKDAKTAIKALLAGQKVDFTTPDNSRLVKRLAEENHNCWGDCQANGAEMLAAIEAWSAKVQLDSGDGGGGAFGTTAQPVSSLVESMTLASVDTSDPDTVRAEAEALILKAPMAVASNAAALNGSYIAVADGPVRNADDPAAGTAELRFEAPADGEYRIFARVLAPTQASNSLYIKVDGGAFQQWDPTVTGNQVQWQESPVRVTLTKGPHVVVIQSREPGTGVDQVAVTKNAAFTGPNTPAGNIAPPRGRVLRWDVSGLADRPEGSVLFELNLRVIDGEGVYEARYPTVIVKGSSAVFVKGIHVLINGVESPQATNFLNIGRAVEPPGMVLMNQPMTVNVPADPEKDTIEIRFDSIE